MNQSKKYKIRLEEADIPKEERKKRIAEVFNILLTNFKKEKKI